MTDIARTIHTYEIVGYDAYFVDVLPDLTEILSELTDENSYFIIAINEAVCNAAKYSVYGYEEAKIKIELVITNEDVTATVISKTKPFNALEYRNKLLKLKENPKLKDMPWSEYTGISERSRGFWMMLMAVDYLYIDINSDRVSLNISIPRKAEEVTLTIGELIKRFFVEKDGVVIP